MKRRNFLSMLPLFGMFSTVAASGSGDNEVALGEACTDLRSRVVLNARTEPLPRTTFARWFCELNDFQWPEGWGEALEDFRRMQQLPTEERATEFDRLGGFEAMKICHRFAGGKECARIWNVEHQSGLTNAEFEKWWLEEGSGERTALALVFGA